MSPGDILEWSDAAGKHAHQWRVRGIHLGALGQESIIEVENVSHKPGWTGPWETHALMFIPECLLRQCRIVGQDPLPYRPNIIVRFLTWLISAFANWTDRYDRRRQRRDK